MSIAQYFFEHYIMLTELIGLSALLGTGVHLPEKTKSATKVSIFLIVLESIIWSVEEWTQNHDGHIVLRAMLTGCVYCMHPIIVTMLIEMTAPIKKHRVLLYLPLFIYVPIVLTSQWTHWIYYIDEMNCWHGNGVIPRYIPYIVFFAYAIVFVIHFVTSYIKYNLYTMLGVLYIVVASFAGVFLNLLRDSASDYATLFSSVIVLYYLFMYQHVSRIDYMTGMMNRQAFYHDMNKADNGFTAICSVDMNELKWINDTKGHEAGDRAIKAVADCLMKKSGPYKHAYRVGGDEFMILYAGKNEKYVQEDIEQMRTELTQNELICAFGYCLIDKNKAFEESLREADKEMYADKARLKKEVVAAGGKLHRRAEDHSVQDTTFKEQDKH